MIYNNIRKYNKEHMYTKKRPLGVATSLGANHYFKRRLTFFAGVLFVPEFVAYVVSYYTCNYT